MASVAFEVVFSRGYTLEVKDGDGAWLLVGSGGNDARALEPIYTRAGSVVVAGREDMVQFRLTVDNGYPWSFSQPYDARVQGVILAEGVIAAGARSTGESLFEIRAAPFIASTPKEAASNITFAYIDVQINRNNVGGNFQIQEVS